MLPPLPNMQKYAMIPPLPVEVYRSGHNGTDSKSVEGQLSVGSNPTASANKKKSRNASCGFSFCIIFFYAWTVFLLLRLCAINAGSAACPSGVTGRTQRPEYMCRCIRMKRMGSSM